MLCSSCNHDLFGLRAGHCPECGAAFDPDDARTWIGYDEVEQTRTANRDRLMGVLIAILVMGGGMAIAIWMVLRP